MKSLFLRLMEIEDELKSRGHDSLTIIFKDGTSYEMTEKRIWPMFTDTINKRPNADAAFFLEQLKAGNPDEQGLAYSLEPYTKDPDEVFNNE